MVQFLPGEEWKEFNPEGVFKFRYAISNSGRLVSFTDAIENGNLLRGCFVEGYKIIRFKNFSGRVRNRCLFVHRLLADNFIPKDSEEQTHILHLDYNRGNNNLENLKWGTQKEHLEHHRKNPRVIEGRKKRNAKSLGKGHKLTEARVVLIKKKIFDPNRKTKLKLIAKMFGISEMQLHRIKSGENWGHVAVDQKP